MKIILQDVVKDLGVKGDVLEVADGYARNYLLPKGYAVKATPHNLKLLEKVIKAREEQKKAEIEKAKEFAIKLEDVTVVIRAKVGEKGKLYGSVTNNDIAVKLQEDHNLELEKRKIELKDPIKETGFYNVPVKLHSEVHTEVKVQVEKEQEEEQEQETPSAEAKPAEAEQTEPETKVETEVEDK